MSEPSTPSLRRSSRLQAKRTPSYADNEEDDTSASVGPSSKARKPPVKRARKSASSGDAAQTQQGSPPKALGPRGRRRTLSKLVDMPLDILFEIFGHLHPLDLVHLSRTTKALRNILMRRSAVSIWRNARESVEDLPDCPQDLTEPAYANLLFDHHCHFCVKARVMTTLWTCRSRACKACLKEHFLPLFDVLVAASKLLPAGTQQPVKTSTMLPMEYISNKLLVPKGSANELLDLMKKCNRDEASLKLLEQERALYVKQLKESALQLVAWQIKQNAKRTMDLMDLRVRRRRQIIERLCSLGYGDDLKWMTFERVEQFIEHPLVKQPKELTDRIWNNIREPMIAFAEEARTERLMRERCVHYINRLAVVRDTVVRFLSRRPLWETLPSIADFSYHDTSFRLLLDARRDAFFQPPELPPAQLEATLNTMVREWRVAMAKKLYNMIIDATFPSPAASTATATNAAGPSAPSSSAGTSVSPTRPEPTPEEIGNRVYSATTWFRCTSPTCGALLDYPRVLSHTCAHAAPALNLHPTTDADDLRNAYALVLEETPWNFTGDRIVFDRDAQAAAEAVVRACGRDPGRTDGWQMAQGKPRFVCSLCSRDGEACVLAWKHAVAHLYAHTKAGQTGAKVTRLSKRDARIVRSLEPGRLIPYLASVYKMWGCTRCRVGPPMTLVETFDHCSTEHMVDMAEEGEDYDLHPDAETERHVPAHDMFYDASLFLTPIRR